MAAAARDGGAAAELRNARTEIAPFIALHVQFRKAFITQRDYKRARATAARLLAAAEKAMPADSLVLAQALRCVLVARMLPVEGERFG